MSDSGISTVPPPALLRRLYALTCLLASAVFWWPLALLRDKWIKRTDPQSDADGPEYVLGSPARNFWIYDRRKSGHRGFFPSLLGPKLGSSVQSVFSLLNSGSAAKSMHRSSRDNSSSEDTLLLHGTVTDRATGQPVPEVVLHVWQADPRGEYAKYGDLDLDFDFRGYVTAAGQSGKYAVGTLYPTTIGMYSASPWYLLNAFFCCAPSVVLWLRCHFTGQGYPDIRRPPHMHFYVAAPGYKTLVTQLYFPDRLGEGEFADILKTDPAHPPSTLPLNQELLLHPSIVSAARAGANREGTLPTTRWAVCFDFKLERLK
jgi:protocatechuate 3,4-dioxygenase beta subunit